MLVKTYSKPVFPYVFSSFALPAPHKSIQGRGVFFEGVEFSPNEPGIPFGDNLAYRSAASVANLVSVKPRRCRLSALTVSQKFQFFRVAINDYMYVIFVEAPVGEATDEERGGAKLTGEASPRLLTGGESPDRAG